MAQPLTVETARGKLALWNGRTLTALIVDASGAAAAADTMANVSEVEADELAVGGYVRQTFTGLYEQVGDEGHLRIDPGDSPSTDTTGAYPAGVWFFDAAGSGPLGITAGQLIAFLPVAVGAGFAGWDIVADPIAVVRGMAAAAAVSVDATGFTGNLSGTDTDVQTALETIDALVISGGASGASGAELVDLTAETWPIAADLSASTKAAALVLLPAPASADPLDSVLNITLPPAADGATFGLRLNVASSDLTAVAVNVDGSENGGPWADPFGVRDTATDTQDAWCRVGYFDGAAVWRTLWVPQTVTGGGGGVSLGETSTTAYRGDRGKTAYDHSQTTTGNPHGTTPADITGFDTAVRTSRLDQMAAAGADVAMGSHKITGLANGASSTDAAAFGQIPTASSSTPAAPGTAAAGSSTSWAKGDHVHPYQASVIGGQDEGTSVTSTTDTSLLDAAIFISGQSTGDTVVGWFTFSHTNTSGSGRTHSIKPKLGATTLGTLSYNCPSGATTSGVGFFVLRSEGASDHNFGAAVFTSNSGVSAFQTVTTENLSTGADLDLLGATGAGGSQTNTLQLTSITRHRA